MTPTAGPAQTEPLSGTLRRLIVQSISIAQGRLELVKGELGDERDRLGQLLTRGLFAAFLVFLTVQLIAMLAVALSWDTSWRIPVVVGLATAALVGTFLMIRSYRLTPASTLFEASVEQLQKDVQAIDRRP